MNNYTSDYDQNFLEYNYENSQRIIFHKLKNSNFNKNLPVFIFDVDHTLLQVSELKKYLNQEIAKINSKLSPDKWSETYQQSKTKENFYDYKLHSEILAKLITNSNIIESSVLIQNKIFNTLDKYVPKLIYKNLINFINENSKKFNFIIATSGSGEFQSRKVSSLIKEFKTKPDLIIYIENMKKGKAISLLQNQFSKNKLYIFDDNLDELLDIENEKINANLIRIKQINGQYNSKVLENSLSQIKDLDLENQMIIEFEQFI